MAKSREDLLAEAQQMLEDLTKADLVDMLMEKLDDLDTDSLADWVDNL